MQGKQPSSESFVDVTTNSHYLDLKICAGNSWENPEVNDDDDDDDDDDNNNDVILPG